MSAPDTTCWTIIEGAAGGVDADIARFIDLYGPVVHAYLRARWRGKPAEQLVDDAVQDVFLECFKEGGVLERAKGRGLVSFRGFLVGVARNVSLRYETAKAKNPEVRAATSFEPADPSAESELARVFDRAWAEAMVRDASARQAERARIIGADAVRRVELLDLHFSEGLPIRDIAKRWTQDLKVTHREFERAQREFEDALRDVIAFHYADETIAVEKEIAKLLDLLST